MTVEQVADGLEAPVWLNVATRARALQLFKAHMAETIRLIGADLELHKKRGIGDKATALMIAFDLREFTPRLLDIYMEGGKPLDGVWGALVMMNDPAIVAPLLKRVEKDPGSLPRCSGFFLGPLDEKPAPPELMKLLDSPDTEIRYHAAYALQEWRDPALAQPTVRLAHEKDVRFRSMAAHWASKLQEEAFLTVREELLPLLSDQNEEVRLAALRCFGQRKDLAAGPVILDLLRRDKIEYQYKVTVRYR